LGTVRLITIGVVGISLLLILGFATTRMSRSPLAILYTELDSTDASAIAQKLDGLKIPYTLDNTGSTIRVDSSQVGKVRMIMAAQGLPKGGSVGYELFDQKEGFGTTSFVQNINHLRALEGELARTINAMNPISSSRVHLVLPQRDLFSQSRQMASASVFLKTHNGASLSREQIVSIQNLIAAAVPQLQAGQVSIVDSSGNLLARPNSNIAGGGALPGMSLAANEQEELRLQFEQAQTRKIEDILNQTLGYGKVRAQVSAELDFDRISTSSEIFDPDSQVIRSSQNINENSSNSEGNNSDTVSVANNIPNIVPAMYGSGSASNKSSRSEETVNYEINKTIRNQVREGGQVRRLSAAVVVDGTYTTVDGTVTYVPRTEEEMAKIREVVKNALNFDETRGDTLEVVNMQFAKEDLVDNAGGFISGIPNGDLLRISETIILSLVAIFAILLIVRPILRKLLEAPSGNYPSDSNLIPGIPGIPALANNAPSSGEALPAAEGEVDEEENPVEKMIDISKVEGRVKESSVRKVGEIVNKHPDAAVEILRNWMYQENR